MIRHKNVTEMYASKVKAASIYGGRERELRENGWKARKRSAWQEGVERRIGRSTSYPLVFFS